MSQERGDVLLLRRLLPSIQFDGEQDCGARKRHPPFHAERVGPFVDRRDARSSEVRSSLVDEREYLPSWAHEKLSDATFLEIDISPLGKLGRRRDQCCRRRELLGRRTDEDDEVLIAQARPLQDGSETGVVGIRIDLAQGIALRLEVRSRGRQDGDAQARLVELDLEEFSAFPN